MTSRPCAAWVVVSVHWGANWGYEIPDAQRRFAHALIDRTNVSVIHGHSSHHPRAIDVYRDRLILYQRSGHQKFLVTADIFVV